MWVETPASQAQSGGFRCLQCCPVHCQETVDRINAQLQATLRIGALVLSSLCTLILLVGGMMYSMKFDGRVLPLPIPAEFIWAIVLSPWCGEGIGKLVGMAKSK